MNIPPVQKRAAPRGLSISEVRARITAREQLAEVAERPLAYIPLRGWDAWWEFCDGDDSFLVLTVGPEKVRVWSTDDYATVWGVLAGNADEQDVDVWYDGVRWDGTRTEVQTRPWTLGEAARWA